MPKSGSVRKGEIQLSVMCQSNARRLLSRDDECPQTSIVHKCPQIANVNPFCLLCPLMAIAAIEPRIKGRVPMGSDPLFPCGVRPFIPVWGQTLWTSWRGKPPVGSDHVSQGVRPHVIAAQQDFVRIIFSFCLEFPNVAESPMGSDPLSPLGQMWGQTLWISGGPGDREGR